MSTTAELIGAAVSLVGLGFLTLRSVRSITRRPPPLTATDHRSRTSMR
ncbi:hypothetical protein ACWC24_33320 [Streptomyces sp. NPDC001443]